MRTISTRLQAQTLAQTLQVACGPGSLELSNSYMDMHMASKLFTFTLTFTA